jgi:hypothetical protein
MRFMFLIVTAMIVGCSSKPTPPTKIVEACPFKVGDIVMFAEDHEEDWPILTVEKIYPETKTVMVSYEYKSDLGRHRKDSEMLRWTDIKLYDPKALSKKKVKAVKID